MSIVKIDASNASNFKQKTIMPKGRYLFEVAKDLVVSRAKSSDNNIVSVELRCQDEGEYKGSVVFDTIVLTNKAEWKLCHLALAAGSQSEEDIKNNGIDLSLIKGCVLTADISVEPGSTAPDGTTYREKNQVERYVFEPESSN